MAWWSTSALPSRGLLRSALTALAAGQDLPAEDRTLLLRAALHHRRGLLTALRYMDDPERTGVVLAEALTADGSQRLVELVKAAAERDPHAVDWRRALLMELRTIASGSNRERAALATSAYGLLMSTPSATELPTADHDGFATAAPVGSGTRRRPTRKVLWLIALVCVMAAGAVAVMLRAGQPGMVEAPGGDFALPLTSSDGVPRVVSVRPFAIDRFEVTNREYLRCYERGDCEWPSDSHLQTTTGRIENYFTDPTYETFPVVNVSHGAANTYCRWVGKRLPSEEEWVAAASVAPATGRVFVYPWGDLFGQGRANTLESGRGAPVAVGSHSPAGDSPSGAADMAGNVAEWTATLTGAGDMAVVKGGSYRDGQNATLVSAAQVIAIAEPAGWIGFRCASD